MPAAGIDAIGFDLDGTLYPNHRFYSHLIPFVLKEYKLLRALGKARDIMRAAPQDGYFYELQAKIMAEILKDDPRTVQDRMERLVYRGWEPIFKKVRLFPHVHETLDSFRKAGIKLGLLSDFPAELKLEYLGLGKYWDTVLSSEDTGRLKPDKTPFLELARRLETEPGKMLYVGNSVSYDVNGAKGVGMLTALLSSCPLKKHALADFVFNDYRKLRAFVLD